MNGFIARIRKRLARPAVERLDALARAEGRPGISPAARAFLERDRRTFDAEFGKRRRTR